MLEESFVFSSRFPISVLFLFCFPVAFTNKCAFFCNHMHVLRIPVHHLKYHHGQILAAWWLRTNGEFPDSIDKKKYVSQDKNCMETITFAPPIVFTLKRAESSRICFQMPNQHKNKSLVIKTYSSHCIRRILR